MLRMAKRYGCKYPDVFLAVLVRGAHCIDDRVLLFCVRRG